MPETDSLAKSSASAGSAFRGQATSRPRQENEVRLDLALWDSDHGKRIRLRAPSTVTRSSMNRFLESLRLLVRVIDDPVTPAPDATPAAGNTDDDSD